MGHKTHPLGFRLGITQHHKSTWYSKLNSYSQLLKEDDLIRSLILDSLSDPALKSTGITKILIYRNAANNKINLEVQTAKPGVLVGKEGFRLKEIYTKLAYLFPTQKAMIDVDEIKMNDVYHHADLLGDILVIQLEDRIPFRRAMKGIIEKVQEQNIAGIKIQIAGRVNGAEIARTEWLREGRVPLQTLRANIEYSYKTAQTIYGILGIKIWLFKGDIINTRPLLSESH